MVFISEALKGEANAFFSSSAKESRTYRSSLETASPWYGSSPFASSSPKSPFSNIGPSNSLTFFFNYLAFSLDFGVGFKVAFGFSLASVKL